jgi:hypothetical protein
LPSAGDAATNVLKGLLCTTMMKMKNISTAETTATTHGISSRCRSRLVATATEPKTASRNTQNMIDPSRPPQYDVIL